MLRRWPRWALGLAFFALAAACRPTSDGAPRGASPEAAPSATREVSHDASTRPRTVMALGDSITDGLRTPGGYRVHLAELARARGVELRFVGSLRNGPSELTETAHEGHSNWRIYQLDARVTEWVKAFAPEIVLLMIGTNDVYGSLRLPEAPARVDAVVEHIHAASPTSRIFVASLPPLDDAARERNIVSFNSGLGAKVASRAAEGWPVTFVDVHAAISTRDLIDDIHPSIEGHRKIAEAWWRAIDEYLGAHP